MSSLSPEATAITILQTTQHFVRLSKEQIPDDKNPLEQDLTDALERLSIDNLLRLGTKQPLSRRPGVEDAIGSMNLWAREETQLDIGRKARQLFVARQNEALTELVKGREVTISRLDGATPRALATHSFDGFQPVEGPVSNNFVTPVAEYGRLDLGVVPTEIPIGGSMSHSRWIAHVINGAGEPQLGIRIGKA